MNQTTQNIIGAMAIIFILGVVSFAHKANENATETKVVCYNTVNNVASGISETRLIKMLNTCNKYGEKYLSIKDGYQLGSQALQELKDLLDTYGGE